MLSAEAIQRLTSDDPIPALLGGDTQWHRTYGRSDLREGATLLYESTGEIPALRAVRIGQGDIDLAGLGNGEIEDWDQDGALPILAMIRRRHPQLQPVRYRPGKRCTFKSTGRQTYYAKVVADDRGAEIVRNSQMLWSVAVEGRLGFGVARPAGWLPSMQMIVHHALPGTPVANLLRGPEGPALARSMGTANASLAASRLIPPTRYDYHWQMRRSEKYVRRLARCLPSSTPVLNEIMDGLASVEGGAAGKPIHGAPHAHQWLLDGAQLYLVDFDRFGLGDPELDVATFLAEWDFESGGDTASVGEAYAQAFADVVALDSNLVEAYRIHKYVAKALRTLTAIRIDAAERSLQILETAARRARSLA